MSACARAVQCGHVKCEIPNVYYTNNRGAHPRAQRVLVCLAVLDPSVAVALD